MVKTKISELVLIFMTLISASGFLGCKSGEDTFFIVDYTSGLRFGPFENKDSFPVRLAVFSSGESYFTEFGGYVVRARKDEIITYRLLHQTTVSIRVRDQTLTQFAETLNEIQKNNGVAQSDRIKFTTRINAFWNQEEEVPDGEVFLTNKFIRQKRKQPLITLQGDNVSLFDLLLHVSHLLHHRVFFFEYDHEIEMYLLPMWYK